MRTYPDRDGGRSSGLGHHDYAKRSDGGTGPPHRDSRQWGPVFVALGPCAVERGLTCIGGYWVREVNRAGPARLVADFDVSRLGAQVIGQTQGGGDTLIFEGRYEPVVRGEHSLAFVATAAWRGLPDVAAPDGDSVVAITKADGGLVATPANSTSETRVESVTIQELAPPMVDTTWLTSRILEGGALVAGAIRGSTLDASQVFVHLPAGAGPCKGVLVHCEGDETPTFARDANLCLVPTGCVARRACPLYRPVCNPGYVLSAWAGAPTGCDVFACDPRSSPNDTRGGGRVRMMPPSPGGRKREPR